MITCKNCGNTFEGNFCNQCGQPAETHEMNFHFLVHDVQHGLLHLDKGIFYTIKELFRRPGHAIREYIEGKRVNHFKPISMILVLAGAFGLLSHFFHIDVLSETFKVDATSATADELKALENLSDWVSGHYAIISLLLLPIFTMGTFLAFRNKGLNFVEHLVLNAYLTGQRLVVRIVLFPLYYWLNGTKHLEIMSNLVGFVTFCLTLWTLMQFFDTVKKSTVFWRTLLSFIISGALYLAIGLAILLVFF